MKAEDLVASRRVYELAKEFGVESRTVMIRLQEMGEFVRSASSTVHPVVIRRLRQEFQAPIPESARAQDEPRGTADSPRPIVLPSSSSRVEGDKHPPASSSTAGTAGSPRDGFLLKDPGTLIYVDALIRDYPIAGVHRQALQALRSDFSFAAKLADGSWVALVHFGPGIMGLYGFTREVLALYSPHHELQPRLFKHLPDNLSRLPAARSAEDHVFLVYSPDVTAARKLDSWSPEAPYTAIALPLTKDGRRASAEIFLNLHSRLATRNLYDEALPVTGRDFFGRRQLLAQLVDELRQGNVCGIFGLRKSGKTSLVKELGQRFQKENEQARIFLLRDLESLPTNSTRILPSLIADLRDSFLVEFRKRDVRTRQLVELAPGSDFGEFRRALQVSLVDCGERQIQVVLALDELESLIGDARELRTGSRSFVPEVLGGLRSLVQENTCFNVVVSGITSAALENGYLYGRENPMFSWAKAFYLPPLPREEIDQLTQDVGRRMALAWTSAALDLAFQECGGNVFLHRTLAATIASHLPVDPAARIVTETRVRDSLSKWKRALTQKTREMFESTERHYPFECELLASFVHDRQDFDDLKEAFPAEVHRLLMLGLMTEDDSGELDNGPLTQFLAGAGLL